MCRSACRSCVSDIENEIASSHDLQNLVRTVNSGKRARKQNGTQNGGGRTAHGRAAHRSETARCCPKASAWPRESSPCRNARHVSDDCRRCRIHTGRKRTPLGLGRARSRQPSLWKTESDTGRDRTCAQLETRATRDPLSKTTREQLGGSSHTNKEMPANEAVSGVATQRGATLRAEGAYARSRPHARERRCLCHGPTRGTAQPAGRSNRPAG